MKYTKDPNVTMIPSTYYIGTANLVGKTILITGATSGLGFATAKTLACLHPKTIIFGIRDLEKGKQSIAQIKQFATERGVPENTIPQFKMLQVDFGDLQSTKSFGGELLNLIETKEITLLDIAFLNAGLQSNNRQITKDGIEKTLQVNYVSQFLFTELLRNKGFSDQDPRVIFTSSGMHRLMSTLEMDDLNFDKRKYVFSDAYCQSKLCQLLYLRYLSKNDPKIKYLAVEPGPVKTDIYRQGFEEPPWEGFEDRPSPDEGAFPMLYCCIEDVKTGEFRKVPDGRPAELSAEAQNDEKMNELIAWSKRTVQKYLQ